MKGAAGLVVALLLGMLGAALNYVYLDNKTRQVKSVSFIGVRDDVKIRPGDQLKDTDLIEVRIPEMHVGNLKTFVYLWQDRETVQGIRAIRPYQGGELLRREDYRTPPPELKLGKGQMLVWIAVDSRAFVPDLVNPGDKVTFLLPALRGGPTPAPVNQQLKPEDPNDPTGAPAPTAPGIAPAGPVGGGGVEALGPFVIAAVGNRLGSAEVSRATIGRTVSDFELGIYVKNEGTDLAPMIEARAMRLIELSRRSGNQGIGVALHPRTEEKTP